MSPPPPLPVVQAVVRVPLGSKLAPERAALLVRDEDRPFALIGRWAGGAALVGSEPIRVAADGEDPFALLDEQPALPDAEGLQSGAVGAARDGAAPGALLHRGVAGDAFCRGPRTRGVRLPAPNLRRRPVSSEHLYPPAVTPERRADRSVRGRRGRAVTRPSGVSGGPL